MFNSLRRHKVEPQSTATTSTAHTDHPATGSMALVLGKPVVAAHDAIAAKKPIDDFHDSLPSSEAMAQVIHLPLAAMDNKAPAAMPEPVEIAEQLAAAPVAIQPSIQISTMHGPDTQSGRPEMPGAPITTLQPEHRDIPILNQTAPPLSLDGEDTLMPRAISFDLLNKIETVISRGLHSKGDFVSDDEHAGIRIVGTHTGDIVMPHGGVIHIGPTGVVTGQTIEADFILVEGTAQGHLVARKCIELMGQCMVTGEIDYREDIAIHGHPRIRAKIHYCPENSQNIAADFSDLQVG